MSMPVAGAGTGYRQVAHRVANNRHGPEMKSRDYKLAGLALGNRLVENCGSVGREFPFYAHCDDEQCNCDQSEDRR